MLQIRMNMHLAKIELFTDIYLLALFASDYSIWLHDFPVRVPNLERLSKLGLNSAFLENAFNGKE